MVLHASSIECMDIATCVHREQMCAFFLKDGHLQIHVSLMLLFSFGFQVQTPGTEMDVLMDHILRQGLRSLTMNARRLSTMTFSHTKQRRIPTLQRASEGWLS